MQKPNRVALPIDAFLSDITAAFAKHDNVILTAPPGSGKTTRTPAELMQVFKKIIVLVPRRIAALSSAARIAEENGLTLGHEVGYQVRFDSRCGPQTQLLFMTEGVFIKKINDAEMWKDLELVIFDEFHERSSHLDLALGLCSEKQLLEQKPKILVMSATLNTSKLQTYLDRPALIEVSAAPHPLEIIYSKKSQRLMCDFVFAEQLQEALTQAANRSQQDILVFLPGLGEIRFIERQLQGRFSQFEFNILHGSVPLAEQRRILAPSDQRRIILSTNVAESSLTLPSVDAVVDSGLEKKAVTESKIGFKRLELNRISQFSAKQRAGRAARTGPGVCYRLWHELDERSMPEQIEPEVIESDLLEESLTLLSAGVSNPDSFSWLDRPKKTFKSALEQLRRWDLIDDGGVTSKGQLVQSCPLDIERSVLFLELARAGWQKPGAKLMAFLETADFERLHEMPDLDDLPLTEQGRRIESQLLRLRMGSDANTTSGRSFRLDLIEIFFRRFAHRIAKRKEGVQAVSSLGRGIELSKYLVSRETDYFALLSGREFTAALTKSDFAIGFSTAEFEALSAANLRVETKIDYDSEKRRLYKTERKLAGNFVVNESAKSFLNETESREHIGEFLREHFAELLAQHEQFARFEQRVNFLRKKAPELGYTGEDFDFLNDLTDRLHDSIEGSLSTVEDFFNLNLYELLLYQCPERIAADLRELPGHFALPSGKTIAVDYDSEQAPKISARIQEFFGVRSNPTVLGGRVRMTVELLAPNYRPAQVTSQLENFWKSSYLDVRKDLKARYPKHAWPENPLEYVPEKKK